MSSRLLQYLSTCSPAEPPLPLMHATDIYAFREISEAGVLNPALSDDFKENLVCLFYGRPGYRIGARSLSRSDALLSPVCFVFKASAVIEIARIYPFDTGAYTKKLYRSSLIPKLQRDHFSLGTDSVAPQRLVAAFFENNHRYFFGTYRQDLAFAIDEIEAQAYYNIIAQRGETPADDRRYTVEFQTRRPVALAGSLLGIVLPHQFLAKVGFTEILKLWGARAITYHTINGFQPCQYHGLVAEKVRQFLEEEGLLLEEEELR